jgi:hypothetical protein
MQSTSIVRLFRNARLPLSLVLVAGLFALHGGPAQAKKDVYADTDDYKDGEEIVDVFFGEAEYSILVEDFERNGEELDWGWALTPEWESGSRKLENEPKQLAFDLSSYSTVRIPEVENFAGIMKDDELASVRESFELAVKQLGLEAVRSGDADLELKAVVVDINRKGGGFGLIKVDPFIEMEVRLRDLGRDRDLLLIRNQEHADTPDDAALDFASQLARFLR